MDKLAIFRRHPHVDLVNMPRTKIMSVDNNVHGRLKMPCAVRRLIPHPHCVMTKHNSLAVKRYFCEIVEPGHSGDQTLDQFASQYPSSHVFYCATLFFW